MNNQFPAITVLRGIAALFILIHHTAGYFLPEMGGGVGQFSPFIRKSYLWVDFFFMLSGFVLSHVYCKTFQINFWPQKYKTFIVSRFARIYPLHLMMLLCLVCLAFFQNFFDIGPGFTGKQSLFSLITNLTLLQALHFSSWNEPAWAISAQWLIYFLMPQIIYLSGRTSLTLDIGAISASFLALFMLNWWIGHLDFVGWKALIRCASEMIAGVLIYKYQPQIQLNRCVTAESLTAGLSAVVLFSIGLPINDTLTVCIFPFLIISASAIKGASVFNSPGLIFLGKISYSLYMIHWFFMMFVNTISTFITGNSLHENFTLSQLLPFSIIFIIFNILIASLSYRYVELPFRNGIRRIFNLNMKVI